MNRIVLIGNGFDLAHDLKTSYKDFIEWYWQYIFNSFSQNNSSLYENPLCTLKRKDGISWKYVYQENTRGRAPMTGEQIWKGIREDKDCSVTYSPFFERILKSIETKNWVDIENEYYNLLTEYALKKSSKEELEKLNRQLFVLKDLLVEYLKNIENQTSAFDCIKDKIYAPVNSREIAVGALNYSSEIVPIDRIMLLSFNYTSTAELYKSRGADGGDISCTVNYIHGRIIDSRTVIFGYGDEIDTKFKELQNLNDNECLKNVKTIRYLESDNYRNALTFMESAPYQVCIMGHSCGNSDRTLLNTLFEHKNCVSIKPYYYRKDDGTESYIELVQNISRNFTDMKLMRDRVVNKQYCETLTP